MKINKILKEIRKRLEESVIKNKAEGILFSGGVDTSILISIEKNMKAIHVTLEDCGPDTEYVKIVKDFFNLKVYHIKIKIAEAISAIPKVIKILKSFDPAIPNDIVIYFGVKFAKEMNIQSLMTGDGADEIFAGYSYMKEIKNIFNYIKKISKNMYFNSVKIGEFFNVEIKQPYLANNFLNFSINQVPSQLKLREYKGKLFGKWVLRKAFEDNLPESIVWQSKRPIEYGSGIMKLRNIISSMVCDEEYKSNTYPIKFINKEHLYYYKVYKEVIGEVPKPKAGERVCFGCGAGIGKDRFHCKICGYVNDSLWKKS
jgi:asparagine synthase (glutamine-hydrolysing)